jgi:hypothetical protein
MRRFWLVFLLIMGACAPIVPATIPPQLDDTPEAVTFSIDGNRIYTSLFSVEYPPDWKVVKSNPASQPLSIVLVSPESDMTITLAVLQTIDLGGTTQGTDGNITRLEGVPLGEQTLYLIGNAPPEKDEAFEAIWQRLKASINTSP